MRLFVAVDVTDDVRLHAEQVRRRVVRTMPAAERGLRWVRPDDLHLTLRFIGEVDDESAAFIRDVVVEPLPMRAFTVGVGRPLWIPGPSRPRVFVLQVGAGAEQLRSLFGIVERRLVDVASLAPEPRPFLAHLTLARVRDTERRRVADAAELILSTASSDGPTFPVRGVTLYRSELSPEGPTYTPLAAGRLLED